MTASAVGDSGGTGSLVNAGAAQDMRYHCDSKDKTFLSGYLSYTHVHRYRHRHMHRNTHTHTHTHMHTNTHTHTHTPKIKKLTR